MCLTIFRTGVIALTLCCLSLGAAVAERPNVVVFLVDDMGVMDTSLPFLTGEDGKPKRYPLNSYYRTPNMERLARRGIRFNNFYAMSVCSPTRISIMTGQNAARHHATNWINPDKDNRGPWGPPQWDWQGLAKGDVTLPRLLQGAGYRTIHVGKGHFGPRAYAGAEPRNLGFDINVGGASFGAPGSYYGEQNYGLGTRRAKSAVPNLQKYHGTETFLTEALTIEAKARVADAVEADQPFFLYMSHYAVHAPFHSDPRFAANYKQSGKPAAAQAFATLIEGMDKSLGDILDHLDALGVSEDTLVFFLGDNGSDAPLGHQHAVACAAPLRGKKGAHYEGGMRVPFIAAWAKAADNPPQKRLPIAAGAIQSQTAAIYDLFPTILGLTEVRPPGNHVVDGTRLDTLLTGQADARRAETFLMHYPHAPHRSDYFTCYRDGDWKAIYHYYPSQGSEDSRYQLYNLSDDPFEQNNLAESKPDRLRVMMQGLIASMEQHQALYPLDKADGTTALKPKLAEEIFATQEPQLVLEQGAGEGPAWDPKLGLLFSGDASIRRLDRNGNIGIHRKEAGTNGLLFDRQGRLLACEPVRRRVTRTAADGTIKVLAQRYDGMRFNQPNDITVDSQGRIYFSDPKYGPRTNLELVDAAGRVVEGVYRIDPDGKVTRIITHEVDRPNGLVVTPDDRYLYVADNNNNEAGAARKLWRFDLLSDGTVNPQSQKLIHDWRNSRGPDGMVLDRQGRLYVAGGLNKNRAPIETNENKGGVYVFSTAGEMIDFVPIPRDEVTNCTFGGDDLKTLYVTAGGTLWSIRTTTAGQLPWPAQ